MGMNVNLTVKEAAARLRVSRSTLANWRSAGKGPRFVKFGKIVFYPQDELEAWEKKHLHVAVHVPAKK